ncbi:ribonuclease P protein component [Enterococcus sp. LJL98]
MRKSYRVKKEKEFQKVFTRGKSSANRNFIVYVLPKTDQSHFRIGISVGKKVGNAVQRNAVKRKIRASIFELREEIQPDLDFIVIARPSVQTLSSKEVYSNLRHVLKIAKVMK